MPGSMTVTTPNNYLRADMEPFKLICDWTATSDMAVSLGIAATLRAARTSAPFPERLKGRIVGIETVPGASGDRATFCPYGVYTLTLLDEHNLDILDGNGASRSITAAEQTVFSGGVYVDGELTLTISSVATTDQLDGDGTFAAEANWTYTAGDWTYNAGASMVHDQDGVNTLSHNTFAAIAGRSYELVYTTSSHTAGTVIGKIGNTSGGTTAAAATVTETIVAANTNGLIFTPSNTARFVIDNVTVKYATPKGRVIIWME